MKSPKVEKSLTKINKKYYNFWTNNLMMTFDIQNLQNIMKVIYFVTQSPISNICWDIVPLGLLLGSVDPQTHVLWESVIRSLKLKPAWAKNSEIGWLGSAQKPIRNPSQAWLGLKSMLDFQAKLGSGSKAGWISSLAGLGLGRKWDFRASLSSDSAIYQVLHWTWAWAQTIISWLNTPWNWCHPGMGNINCPYIIKIWQQYCMAPFLT